MNFQAVAQSQNYTKFTGTITAFEGQRQGKYGQESHCFVQDAQGVVNKICFSSGRYNAPLPNQTAVGQTIQISAKCVSGKFYGFWDANGKNGQQTRQQAPQNAAQSTKGSKDDSIIRQCCIKAVLGAAAILPHEYPKYLDCCYSWVTTGKWPDNDNPDGPDYPPEF